MSCQTDYYDVVLLFSSVVLRCDVPIILRFCMNTKLAGVIMSLIRVAYFCGR